MYLHQLHCLSDKDKDKVLAAGDSPPLASLPKWLAAHDQANPDFQADNDPSLSHMYIVNLAKINVLVQREFQA